MTILPADTTPARVTEAVARDSLQIRLTTDDYIDPDAPLPLVRSRTAFSINQRVTSRSSATLRLEHSAGSASGLGADLSWAFYGKLRGHQSSVRLSLFDRPGTRSSAGVQAISLPPKLAATRLYSESLHHLRALASE